MNFLGSVNAGAKGADTPVAQRNPQKVPAPGSALGYDPRYAAVPGVGGPGNSVNGANTPAGGAGMDGKVLRSASQAPTR